MDIRDLVRPPSRNRRYRPRRRRRVFGVSIGELRLVVLAGLAIGLAVPGAEWLRPGDASAPDAAIVSGGMEAGATVGDAGGADAGGAKIGGPAAGGASGSGVARSFGQCHSGGRTNCVVDGDTFWIDGEKIRVADIDAPETHPPRCAEEARLGDAATDRLQALLNAGPVTLVSIDRDTDHYGRKLRVVERGGVSLGDRLVSEGLARPWEGRRRPWC